MLQSDTSGGLRERYRKSLYLATMLPWPSQSGAAALPSMKSCLWHVTASAHGSRWAAGTQPHGSGNELC